MTELGKTTAVDDARVMKIWRECGLPEYFLGNAGTNGKLVKFADAIDEDDNTNVRQVAREVRLQDEARIADLEAQVAQLTAERNHCDKHHASVRLLEQRWLERGEQVAQLQATVGELREAINVIKLRVEVPGEFQSFIWNVANAALATCPAPAKEDL